MPSIMEELETEITRQSVKPVHPGTSSGNSVGFDVGASQLRHDLGRVLDGLETLATGERKHGNMAGRIQRIQAGLTRAVKNPSITGWHTDLTGLLRKATAKIDSPAERLDLGECTCGARVVTTQGAVHAKCRVCGATHEVEALLEERRGRVLDGLAGAYLPLAALPDALAMLGFQVKPRTVASWVERGRVGAAPAGVVSRTGGGRGRPGRYWSVEDAVYCAETSTRQGG
ncbi:hypothetical protein ACIGDM_01020 [Rothia koreensis]|uniref:hypothetical protein n=1 Tax=Rothia koreensis TaxID=592378 RepID=UPI0037C6E8A6